MDRIFSGIQPTGALHLGNWLGAIKNWVTLQERHDAFYCIVDLHALTARPDPAVLRANTQRLAMGVLACGVDPARATLFVQSQVPEHAELAWVLACLTPLGDLDRMTQFKDKSQQQSENVNTGLYTYPVLQAADILVYQADKVPVGEDQDQHLELAREIVRRFNFVYGEGSLPEPQTLKTPAPRVIGLDGVAKMSKSKGNDIGLLEPRESIVQKLKTAKTDPKRLRRSDPGEPFDCNIFSLHRFFSPAQAQAQVERDCRAAAIGCVDCKMLLADGVDSALAPIRERAAALEKDPARIEDVLQSGARRARVEARKTMDLVREKIGIRGPAALEV